MGHQRILSASIDIRRLEIKNVGENPHMWILNTCACELLQIDKHLHLDGIEKNKDGLPTGRLFRLDGWLREQVEEENRALIKPFSEKLLSMGITGFTDASYKQFWHSC